MATKATAQQIKDFKLWVAARDKAVSDTTRNSYQASIDVYKQRYTGLEEFDTKMTTKKDDSKNYIEIKQGGITFRKQGQNLTIVMNETLEYTDANLLAFKNTMEGGLAVIAAAAKFDPPKTATGVDI